jgi:GT2 family glycosyltransferase
VGTSIIIPVYNRLIYTRICVSQLALTISDRSDIEVVIVDNGSSDGTRAFVESLPPPFRSVGNRRNEGFAAACNLGAEHAKCEDLVFLNNDTVPLPGWLRPLEDLLDEAGVGIVGSKLLFPDDTIQHAGVVISESRVPVHVYYAFPGSYPPANQRRDYQAVTGACLGIRRSLFYSLGGFDVGYRNSFEDVDLCLRARVLGQRVVFCPSSVLYHFESATEGRHDDDDSSLQRLLGRWGDALEVDEDSTYRRDGFASVPQLPAQTLTQAVTQLRFERRRARAMSVALCTLVHDRSGESGNGGPTSVRRPVDPVRSLIPNPAPAGSEITVELLLATELLSPAPLGAEIWYEWRLPQTQAVLLRGLAGTVPPTRDGRCIAPVQVSVPSIPGTYGLTWLLIDTDRRRIGGQQVVEVAPKYDFGCRSFMSEPLLAGQRYRIPVILINRGTSSWFAQSRFMLSYHWYDPTGQYCHDWDGLRSPIQGCVEFGEEIALVAALAAPTRPGPHLLRWDLVRDGDVWFSNAGASLVGEIVDIQPSPGLVAIDQTRPPPKPPVDDVYARTLAAKERTIAALQQTVARVDAKRPDDMIRARDEIIAAQQRELTRREDEMNQLRALISAIERGRVMRMMNVARRLRRRLLRF